MSREVAAGIGSGTIGYTRGILPASQRGIEPLGEGVRTGIQVMLGNPEDLVAVDAFAASGIAVSTTPIKIFGASQCPLGRARKVLIENGSDSSTLVIANAAAKIPEGWQLVNGAGGAPRAFVELPVMAGTDIWAASAAGVVQVRMLIF